jgi:hypothetical protein
VGNGVEMGEAGARTGRHGEGPAPLRAAARAPAPRAPRPGSPAARVVQAKGGRPRVQQVQRRRAVGLENELRHRGAAGARVERRLGDRQWVVDGATCDGGDGRAGGGGGVGAAAPGAEGPRAAAGRGIRRGPGRRGGVLRRTCHAEPVKRVIKQRLLPLIVDDHACLKGGAGGLKRRGRSRGEAGARVAAAPARRPCARRGERKSSARPHENKPPAPKPAPSSAHRTAPLVNSQPLAPGPQSPTQTRCCCGAGPPARLRTLVTCDRNATRGAASPAHLRRAAGRVGAGARARGGSCPVHTVAAGA